MDETGVRVERCEMGSEGAAGNEVFIVKTLGQKNV
jgi:hypothetical protein